MTWKLLDERLPEAYATHHYYSLSEQFHLHPGVAAQLRRRWFRSYAAGDGQIIERVCCFHCLKIHEQEGKDLTFCPLEIYNCPACLSVHVSLKLRPHDFLEQPFIEL